MVNWRMIGIGIYAIGLLVAGVYGLVEMTSTPQAQFSSTSCTDAGLAAGALPTCLPSETIAETGSALMYPLINLWIHNTDQGHSVPDFNTLYSNVAINTVNSGSGVGILYAENRQVQLGASSAFLSDSEQGRNPNLLNIAVAVTAVIVNYNLPGFSSNVHLNFTGTVLSEMYNGTISSWDDSRIKEINPGAVNLLPARTVRPVHRSDASGDTLHFTEYLSRSDLWWNKNVGYGLTVSWPNPIGNTADSIIGNPGIVIESGATPYSVSYVSVEALDLALNTYKLGAGYVYNHDGKFVSYSAQNIEAGLEPIFAFTPADERISL